MVTAPRSKDTKSSDSSSSSKPRKRPVRTVSTPSNVSPAKKPRPTTSSHQGRDYDLNEIRSELKGLHTVKQETEEVKQEVSEKEASSSSPPQTSTTTSTSMSASTSEASAPEKQPEDVYEFKEPEPFELELHDEKKKRTHRIFDDISPSKYTSTLSKSLSEEISEDPLKTRTTPLRSPSLSPFRDFGATSAAPGRQSPEEDSKDGLFSLDEDSFPGDSGSAHRFEGFIPAKNQETYSKKSKVSKLRQLIDDSPDSRADDEQSSEDESEDIAVKEEIREPSPVVPISETSETSEPPLKGFPKSPEPAEEMKEENNILSMLGNPEKELELLESIPEPPNTPPPFLQPPMIELKDIPIPSTPSETTSDSAPDIKEEQYIDEPPMIDLDSIPLPTDEPKDNVFVINQEPKENVFIIQDLKENPFISRDTNETATNVKETNENEAKVPPPESIQKPKEMKESVFQPKDFKEISPKVKEPKENPFKPKDPKDSTIKPRELKESVFKATDPKEGSSKTKDKDPKENIFKLKDPVDSAFKRKDVKETTVKVSNDPKDSVFKQNRDSKESSPNPKDPKESLTKLKEAKDNVLKIKIDPIKPLNTVLNPPKLEPPSSPLIDTEEDKSEPDSPARIDVIPEPPPAFLVQSEGPKIADKLLKAINSAKRLSMSPPPVEDKPRALIPKTDPKLNKLEDKLSPVPLESKPSVKQDNLRPLTKEPLKKISPPNVTDPIFGEPSNFTDAKRDLTDIKKVKAKDPSPPRLLSPLNILERRKSVADLAMPTPGKNNKVLSDTIQKLSSQINSSQAAAVVIPLPPFPAEDRSESSDSDDSDRR